MFKLARDSLDFEMIKSYRSIRHAFIDNGNDDELAESLFIIMVYLERGCKHKFKQEWCTWTYY